MQGVMKNRREALAASGRGTCEELGIPVADDRARFRNQALGRRPGPGEPRPRPQPGPPSASRCTAGNGRQPIHLDGRAPPGRPQTAPDSTRHRTVTTRKVRASRGGAASRGSGAWNPVKNRPPALRIHKIGRKIAAKRLELPARIVALIDCQPVPRSGRLNCVR